MPPMGSVSKVMWDLVLLLAGFLSSGQRVLAKPLLDIILPCLSFFLVEVVFVGDCVSRAVWSSHDHSPCVFC